MRAMGMADARVDENGYVYGSVPATAQGRPTIGLIAHMDTVDCVPSAPVRARIVENYDGGAVQLDNGECSTPRCSPTWRAKGKSLIVTDGNTLLGADDKAGVAEILTACERLLADPSIPTGRSRSASRRTRRSAAARTASTFRLRRGFRLHRGRRRGRLHRV